MWRPTVAVAALGLLLAGCGQHSSQRADVASYLKQVNRVERSLATPLKTVTVLGAQFVREQRSGGTLTGLLNTAQHVRLQTALVRIGSLRTRLAGLSAPKPAAQLRSLLLQMIDGQMKLTRELTQLVAYLPGLSSALRDLAPATRNLQAEISGQAGGSASAPAKAAALRHFQAVVHRILKQLHQLRPPAFQRPAYKAELASLEGMSKSAGQLAAALETGQGNVQAILARFDRAAAHTQSVAVQKAQIAAVRGYDREIARLAQLGQQAQEERMRLANTLT